ncbi:MAG TPA: hypothetical protein DCR63_08230, partial [Microbacterium sp.]|nr:hypothetical protein [Microbacterium sp.]
MAIVYPVAYAVKFLSKTQLDSDYVVMPLEALRWAGDYYDIPVESTDEACASRTSRGRHHRSGLR